VTTMQLSWTIQELGLAFQLLDGDTAIRVDRWDELSAEQDAPDTGVLSRVLDDDLAELTDEYTLLLPHETVAELPAQEAMRLGLPPDMPFTLHIEIDGIVPRAGSVFRYRFLAHDHPVAFRRAGSVITSDEIQYRVPDPAFALLEGLDTFNALQPTDIDRRLRVWGFLKEKLPKDAVVEEHLRSLDIVVASAVSLTPIIDSSGNADIEPVIGRFQLPEDELLLDSDADPVFEPALPEDEARTFADRFRLLKVRPSYTLGGGKFVVVTDDVQRILQEVKATQGKPAADRRRFAENPSQHLRAALEDEMDEETFSSVFSDLEYSERVIGVGVRAPKILPWLVQDSTQPWFPKNIGLWIGDTKVEIDPDDVDDLHDDLRSAEAGGAAHVEYKGVQIPANAEAIEAVGGLRQYRDQGTEESAIDEDEEARAEPGPKVLLVKENLEELEYRSPARPAAGQPGQLPGHLRSTMLGHQREALTWLQEHWCHGSNGALLADDMGLGKTFEALAFMVWVKEQMIKKHTPRRPFLVVAPTGLLPNWQLENDKHLEHPGLGLPLQGYGQRLKELRTGSGSELQRGEPTLNVAELQDSDWVLTTYETWRDYQHSFALVDWAVAVFDEAQKIKNPAAGVTEAAKAVKAEFVLALTGTPVENRVADMWCIVDAVQPGRLGALKPFVGHYEQGPEEEREERYADLRDKITGGDNAIMLRRMKEDHLEGLPDRSEIQLRVTMPSAQAAAYDRVVREAQRAQGKGAMLRALHQLRSVSLSHQAYDGTNGKAFLKGAARLRALTGILDDLHATGRKALIFVEFLEIQSSLVSILQRRYGLAHAPLVINGSVPGSKRQRRVTEFQERPGFDVMILSPKAGGVGLTLTAANHVIHLSRWWNPAVEDQCSDRIYRIGQDLPVKIHYPLAVHPALGDQSFDILLDSLLRKKRALSRSLLAPPIFDDSDLDDLYKGATRQ